MIRAFRIRKGTSSDLLGSWQGIPVSEAVRFLSLVSRVMGLHNIQVFRERQHGLALGFSCMVAAVVPVNAIHRS